VVIMAILAAQFAHSIVEAGKHRFPPTPVACPRNELEALRAQKEHAALHRPTLHALHGSELLASAPLSPCGSNAASARGLRSCTSPAGAWSRST